MKKAMYKYVTTNMQIKFQFRSRYQSFLPNKLPLILNTSEFNYEKES